MLSNIIKSKLSISTARCLMTTSSALNKLNVAVLLSGCGVYDGSEITEVSSCAIHLTRHKANVHFFAPDANQMEVVNHLTGEVQVESRLVSLCILVSLYCQLFSPNLKKCFSRIGTNCQRKS